MYGENDLASNEWKDGITATVHNYIVNIPRFLENVLKI
jgi:hypothetical protein